MNHSITVIVLIWVAALSLFVIGKQGEQQIDIIFLKSIVRTQTVVISNLTDLHHPKKLVRGEKIK